MTSVQGRSPQYRSATPFSQDDCTGRGALLVTDEDIVPIEQAIPTELITLDSECPDGAGSSLGFALGFATHWSGDNGHLHERTLR